MPECLGGEAAPGVLEHVREHDVGGEHQEGEPERDGGGHGGAGEAEAEAADQGVGDPDVDGQRQEREGHERHDHGLRLQEAERALDEAVGELRRDRVAEEHGGQPGDLRVLPEEHQQRLRVEPEEGDEHGEERRRDHGRLQVHAHHAVRLGAVALPAQRLQGPAQSSLMNFSTTATS